MYLYPAQGVRVTFDAQTERVISLDTGIESKQPTSFKTPLGMGIHSTAADVEQAYKEYPHQEFQPRDKGFGGFMAFTSDKSASIGFGYAGNEVIQITISNSKYYPIH